jgi:hypothetical protein
VSAGAYGGSRAYQDLRRLGQRVPSRVVVEDVRNGRRAVAVGLGAVGAQIETWLDPAAVEPKQPLTRGAPAHEAGR